MLKLNNFSSLLKINILFWMKIRIMRHCQRVKLYVQYNVEILTTPSVELSTESGVTT